MNLRRNNKPGKFEDGLIIDKYVYELSLAGCDDEAGEVHEHGAWYGLFRTGVDVSATARLDMEMTDDEVNYLTSRAGIIVCETDQGPDKKTTKVLVEYFDSTEELERTWQDVQEWYAAEKRDN